MTKKRAGRKFEEAVYAFAKTLDGSAELLFDYKVKDRDTGQSRQCDVWINAKFAGHWPLSILVSCKDHKRKLNSGDVGAFCDEKRSTSASTGVIYSRSGFTKPAIKKAQANGVACCRLYDNEPADLPRSVWIEHFLCKPVIQLALLTNLTGCQLKIWNDLFNLTDRESEKTVLDLDAETFSADEKKNMSELDELLKQNVISFPADWKSDLTLNLPGFNQNLTLRVMGRWKTYRARSEATLLNGSYCVSNGSFRGTQSGPSIDTWSEHPGDAWEELQSACSSLPLNSALAILWGTDVSRVLSEKLGSSPLRLVTA